MQRLWPRKAQFAVVMGAAGMVALLGPAEAKVTHGAVNIVAAENGGRVVAASDEAHERGRVKREWRKENLIDGKRVEGDIVPAFSYGWATTRPPSPREPAWAVFAFAQDRPRLIGAVQLDPRTHDPQIIGRWVRNFAIEVSLTSEDGPWQRVETFELINVPRPQTFSFSAPVRAKYVRLVIASNHGSDSRVSLGEFEVFEALVGDDELTKVIGGLEEQLERLKRYGMSRAGQGGALPTEVPPYDQSLIGQANGGRVVEVSSEAEDEAGNPLPTWRAANLIDGLIATADEQPEHNSFGWSSDAAPTPDHPELIVFEVPGPTGTVIDAAVVDPTTRDPWGMMRGAREIEIAVSTEDPEGPWKVLGRWQLPWEPSPQLLHFPSTEAKYVRLMVLSNYDSDRYVELGEFGVFRLSDKIDVFEGISLRLENCLIDL
jgi:hypothetical protein